MKLFRQIVGVTLLNLKGMRSRLGSSLVVVAGTACVVCVLLSMLSMTIGLRMAWQRAGSPDRAIILAADTVGEAGPITRNAFNIIRDAPGIKKNAKGEAIADAELLFTLATTRKATGLAGYIIVRTFSPHATGARPEFKLVSGRMFQPGKRELIVGTNAYRQFNGVNVGDKVIMPDGEWPIVGAFTTKGDMLEAELVGDTDTVMAAMRRETFSSVFAALDGPEGFSKLKNALSSNPSLHVTVSRHSDYYMRYTSEYSDFYDAASYAVSALLALGALFAAVNILYSSVGARTQEIATLRALGFGPVPIAISVAGEGVILCLAGGAIGAGIAWSLFDGVQDIWYSNVFIMVVSPAMIGLGLSWALLIALLGGIFPAIRAARLPIIDGLRAV